MLQWSNKSQKWGNFKISVFFHEISDIFVFICFFSPKMLRNTSKMAFKSKQAKQSISMGKFQNFIDNPVSENRKLRNAEYMAKSILGRNGETLRTPPPNEFTLAMINFVKKVNLMFII